jgi:adenylate cyclase
MMKKLLLLGLSFVLTLFVFAQTKNVTYIDSIPQQGVLLDKGWKFQVGDNAKWTDANFDDSQWMNINPAQDVVLNLPQIPKDGKIVWFRLRFSLDSTINQPLALLIQQSGASEIYLNGRLVKTIGILNKNPNLIKAYNPLNKPIPILIGKIPIQTLVIRYALQPNISYTTNFLRTNFGFKIQLSTAENATDIYLKTQYDVQYYGGISRTGVLGILSVLFFTLYLYFPTYKASLYFSLYTFLFTIAWIIWLKVTVPSFIEYWHFYYNLILILRVIGFILLLTSVYTILGYKKSWIYWFLVSLSIACIIVCPLIYFWGFILFGFLFTNLIAIDVTRVALIALQNKKKGAWIIVVSGICYLLSWLIFTLRIDKIISNYVEIPFFDIALLSIPVGFAIFLGYDFALTHQLLGKKIIEIETLSLEKQQILENQKVELEKQVKERTLELQETNAELNTTLQIVEQERQKSDNLLLNILPEETAQELKETGTATPKHYDLVSVLFTDFKGFSQIAEKLSPQEVIENLNTCFLALDEICEKHNLEKIKTIGDSYMCAGGIPVANASNPIDCVQAGIEMQAWMANWKQEKQNKGELAWELRLGIHSGAVVAGVIGKNKFAYDIWGDTVNLASRMESSGEAGKVNISGATYQLVKDKFQCTYRGKIEAKNKGEVEMYFVEGIL